MKRISDLKIERVTGGLIGTNCYVLEEKGEILAVDFVPELENLILKKGYDIKKILLTHIHFDHFEGLSSFQERYNFELFLSPKAMACINNPEFNLLDFAGVGAGVKDVDLRNAKSVGEGDSINFAGINIEVFESPGHSEDSLMFIIDEEKVVFSGDTLFYGSVGRTDFATGSFDDILKSIRKLFGRVGEDYVVYPGHGEATKVSFEKRHNPFLNRD